MFWKQVTMISITAGTAEGGTTLNAFDNALLAAGIGNINLIKVSSIVPPAVDVVDLPRIKPGALVPTAYAAMTSTTPGQTVTAAVGYALPADRTKPGVIMEFHDVTDRGTAEQAIRAIQPGRRILVGSGAAQPRVLVEALVAHGDHLADNEIVHLLTLGPTPYVKPGLERRFRHTATMSVSSRASP